MVRSLLSGGRGPKKREGEKVDPTAAGKANSSHS